MQKGTYAEALHAGFEPNQAVFFARLAADTREEAIEEIERRAAEKLKRGVPGLMMQLLRAWALYTVDLAIALTALIVGFGLDVKNWPALIGLGLLSRFVFHVLQSAWLYTDVQAKAARDHE